MGCVFDIVKIPNNRKYVSERTEWKGFSVVLVTDQRYCLLSSGRHGYRKRTLSKKNNKAVVQIRTFLSVDTAHSSPFNTAQTDN